MNFTSRPKTYAERTECADAVAALLADADARPYHPLIEVTLSTTYAAAHAVYDGARVAADAASLQVALAQTHKNACDAAWIAAAERWALSVVDPDERKSAMASVKPLLGGLTLSRFVKQDVQVKLERMPRLLLHVRARPELTGDRARLEAFAASTVALYASVAAWKAALRARKTAVRQADKVSGGFDKAYGGLVRAISDVQPALLDRLPMFAAAPPKADAEAAIDVDHDHDLLDDPDLDPHLDLGLDGNDVNSDTVSAAAAEPSAAEPSAAEPSAAEPSAAEPVSEPVNAAG